MSNSPSVSAIILAAGQGKRMKSGTPKVLHELCGRAMIDYVVAAALDAGAGQAVVVVGHGRAAVVAHLEAVFGSQVRTVVQEPQRGTGDAVRCALPALGDESRAALVLYGDTPLVRADDLRRALAAQAAADSPLAMLTCTVADPTGYGRIVRGARGRVLKVTEERDATPTERAIDEVNPGVYAAHADFLRKAVPELRADNAQGELYLTDIVEMAAKAGLVVAERAPADTLAGINDRAQLAAAEQAIYDRIADDFRRSGVTIRTGARIAATVEIEPDAVIEHDVVLRGNTRVCAGARIDVGSVLTDVEVGQNAVVKPYTVASEAYIGPGAQTGPFAHLRPQAHLEAESKVGNFVEIKKTRLGRGAKASHLAYLGDGEVGAHANVGAGTIFCNYDGFQKHRTVIGPGAFIGSDSQLVAPVTVGENAYVATGSCVTKDVPAEALAIARARQENKEGYAPRLRARMKAAAKKAKG